MRRLAPAVLAIAIAARTVVAQGTQSVYVTLADSIPGTVASAASATSAALTRAGWTMLANHQLGTDASRCGYQARVIVAAKPSHTATVLAKGDLGAYAVPVRIAVFEDERGVHAAMVNPLSLERTMVAEAGLEASGRALIAEAASVVVPATGGKATTRAFGQRRDRGLIGKTMGVMAGGPFADQIDLITTAPATSAADVGRTADALWQRLQQPPRGEWGLRGVYRLDLPERGLVVLGVSGAAMEARAFSIVGAGADDTRDDFKCPGLTHAAAFPLEVVVRRDGAVVRAEAIGAMFRMKMYFEDAGRMKFARNMAMPGSIAKELKQLLAAK
jgi:uncharacterized protein (DUF302 family)